MKYVRVTEKQLSMMQMLMQDKQFIFDFEHARKMSASVGLKPNTGFYTEEEKRVALRFRSFLYNPKDYGMNGKLNEIEKILENSIITGHAMLWAEFNAKPAHKADQRMMYDGAYIAVEHKSSRGDWERVQADNLDDALIEYANMKKWLCWDTQYFTLFMPYAEFIEKLDNYRIGKETFFVKRLSYSLVKEAYLLQFQNWENSPKKVSFLTEMAKSGWNWKKFQQERVLERL